LTRASCRGQRHSGRFPLGGYRRAPRRDPTSQPRWL